MDGATMNERPSVSGTARPRSSCPTISTLRSISSAASIPRGGGARTARRMPANPTPFAPSGPSIRVGPAGPCRGRELQPPSGARLDGQIAARFGGAGTQALRRRPRHLCAALAGAAQSDRAERRAAHRRRRAASSRCAGLDCLDDTPLLDLKPYFASTDAVTEAVVGLACGAAEIVPNGTNL